MIYMYQNYITGQTEFALSYEFKVPKDHITRLIDDFVDSIPQEVLLEADVATTGRPLSHPAIMLKILLFAYSRQTYSYHTINNFHGSNYVARLIKRSFVYFTMALADHGLIKHDAFFIDGTKVKADANKYSFTWRRAVEKYHVKLQANVAELYDELVEKKVVQAMKPETLKSSTGMEEITEQLENEIDQLNEEIKQEPKVIKGCSVKKQRRRFLKKIQLGHKTGNITPKMIISLIIRACVLASIAIVDGQISMVLNVTLNFIVPISIN